MPFWQSFPIAALPSWPPGRRAWAMLRRLLLASLFIWACASTHNKRRVDGSYSIDCNAQKACLDRAATLCGERGYSIIGGRHDQKTYGVPGNQKVVGKDELYIRCNKDALVDAPDPALGTWKLERVDSGVQPTPLRREKKAVCRPGETQRCIGPGACSGGQACAADGSSFGPCDCGEPSSGKAVPKGNSADAGSQ